MLKACFFPDLTEVRSNFSEYETYCLINIMNIFNVLEGSNLKKVYHKIKGYLKKT